MSFPKITQEDLANKGVTGLPDTPNYSTADMQRKFDELSLDVLIPKYNALVEALMATDAAANIGVVAPEGIVGANVQDLLNGFYNVVKACETAKHEHENMECLNGLTDAIYASIEHIVALLGNITNITDTVTGSSTEIPTGKAIAEYIQVLGGGDMLKSIYDPDGDGVVKAADKAWDSETLGGQLPSFYQPVTDETLETVEKTVSGAINEVNNKLNNAKVDTLTTMEQVQAATDLTIPVGVGAVKEMSDSLKTVKTYVDEEGKLHFVDSEGADSVLPFSSFKRYYSETKVAINNTLKTINVGFKPKVIFIASGGVSWFYDENIDGYFYQGNVENKKPVGSWDSTGYFLLSEITDTGFSVQGKNTYNSYIFAFA